MFRNLLIASQAAILLVSPGLAWNRAGHMVTGAIAYAQLERSAPAAVAHVIAILRQHPQYESRWQAQLAGMNQRDQERFLFMLAARWPDDIRGDAVFDHPLWHYIDYPFKPKGQPSSVHAASPKDENLIEAFQRNAAVLRSAAEDDQKAVALCWIFHLIGDAHMPLHAVSLFTTQFPNGDQGGNLFYIQSNPPNGPSGNLHSFWDNILSRDDSYAPAGQIADALEKAVPRKSLSGLAKPDFETWVKQESFNLAVSTVYRKGKLKPGLDRDHGAPLPGDYQAQAKRVGERRVALAGYRLTDFLRTTLP